VKFLQELRNRNIPRVALAYLVTSWLVIQIADTIMPNLGFSNEAVKTVIVIAAAGFLPFLIFSWLFEFTPEGLKREKDIHRSVEFVSASSRKLDIAIIILLAAGLGYFVFDKFVLDPRRDVVMVESAVKSAVEQVEKAIGESTENSLAVLPFVNMSSDPEQEYFSDGLSEELLNLLARIPELRVAARTSSFSFKGEKIEIPVVAERLNVSYVLEGSVRKGGNQIRITAQLIRGNDGYHLWSETYDRTLDDIFTVQDEIASAVVESLKVKLLGDRPRVRVVDPDAYALFLQGRYFNDRRDQSNWNKSVEAYRRALEIDPEYAEAWAGLSITLAQQASWGFIDLDEGMIQAREAVHRALALENNLPEAHTSLGWIRMVYDWDWHGADESHQTAIRLAPANATALAAAAVLAFTLGRLDEAVELDERVLILDPLRQAGHANLGLVLLHAGRLEEASERYRHLLELNPSYPGAHMRLGQIALLQDQPEEALDMILRDSDSWWQEYALPLALYSLGRHEEADQALAYFIEEHPDGPFQAAEIFAWRGEVDEAFEWLERAYIERDSGLHEMMNDPFLANLKDDDRWQPFLDKMELGSVPVVMDETFSNRFVTIW
jgi:TolB-like protein/Flp pilus assembly protein TadD